MVSTSETCSWRRLCDRVCGGRRAVEPQMAWSLRSGPLLNAGDPGAYSRAAGAFSRAAGAFSRTAGAYSRNAGAFSRTAGAFSRTAGAYSRTAGAYAGVLEALYTRICPAVAHARPSGGAKVAHPDPPEA